MRSLAHWFVLIQILGLPACGALAQAPAPEVVVTLDEAIRRARMNEPAYVASAANTRIASLDRSIARAALLPSINFHSQGIYTQPTRTPAQATTLDTSPRFIANNGVREYVSQGVVSETIGLSQVGNLRRADAAALQARAEQEIAQRGLVATVTELFYGALAAENRAAIAFRAHAEAADFVDLTEKREQAREAAHADVVKAQLEEQKRTREREDAQLAADKARLELGILLFPDPRTPYRLAADAALPALASRAEIEAAAAKSNPELKSAFATVSVADADVMTARGALLPSLGLNYTYGIDAAQFAVNGPNQARNLGYAASVTLDLPVWDWLSTQHKVKQSTIRRDVARVALSTTQRRLIAQLDEARAEAEAAQRQLASLDQSVQSAAESLRLTKLRYSSGEAAVLEVVDAQSAFAAAENAREDGRVRYHTALASLQLLTGTM